MRMVISNLANRRLATDLFTEMDRFFDDWNRVSEARVYDERSFDPASEVAETDEHYLMSVDLPGMKKEDIKIEISANVLTVSGERKRESAGRNHRLQRYEKTYGVFKRQFALPTSVEIEKIEARYEDGVLELYLPKAQAARPRQIEVQSGKGGIFDKLWGPKQITSTTVS